MKLNFGLALSGGALRGAAHIGILDVLHENGLEPDLIAGTSAGSIVGALYAAGILPKEMEQLFFQLISLMPGRSEEIITPLIAEPFKTESLGWLPLPKGILKGNFIEKFILKYIGPVTFEDLSLPLAITATDLQTGDLIIFTGEKLIPAKPWPKKVIFIPRMQVAKAVRASTAIPGIFTPKQINGRALLDGGLVDNVPGDVLKMLGARKIVAVDLEFGVAEQEPLRNVLEILLQTHDIMGQRISDLVINKYAHLVIRPKVGNANLLDFGKIPGFIQKGREVGQENLPGIKKLVLGRR